MVVVGEEKNLNPVGTVMTTVQGIVHKIIETSQFCKPCLYSWCVNNIFVLYHRNNNEKSALRKTENVGGIIKLPPNVNVNSTDGILSLSGYLNKTATTTTSPFPFPSKQLFNPNNPNKPIVISPKLQNARGGGYMSNVEPSHAKDHYPINIGSTNIQQYSSAHFGNSPPAWYDPYTERYYCCNKETRIRFFFCIYIC